MQVFNMNFFLLFVHPRRTYRMPQALVQHLSEHSGSNWNLAVLVFVDRGKPENPQKNLSRQGEMQQQTLSHMTLERESNSSQIGWGWELSPLRYLIRAKQRWAESHQAVHFVYRISFCSDLHVSDNLRVKTAWATQLLYEAQHKRSTEKICII